MLTYAYTRLPYTQFSDVEAGQFLVNIEAPNTYSIKDTTGLAIEIEQHMDQVFRAGELDTLLTNVGVMLIDFNRLKLGSNYIQYVVDLTKPKPDSLIERFISPVVNLRLEPHGTRERNTARIIDEIRASIAAVPGVQRFSVLRVQGGPAGPDIEVGIAGQDIERLLSLSAKVAAFPALKTYARI